MPTKHPRVLITVEPAQHMALKFLALQRNQSVSKTVNEMLAPSLAPLLALVEASWDPAQSDLVDYLTKLEAKLALTLQEASEGLRLRGRKPSSAPVGAPGIIPAPDATGGPSPTAAAGAGGGRASIPRSARPSPAPKAPSVERTPGSNTGVTWKSGRKSGGFPRLALGKVDGSVR